MKRLLMTTDTVGGVFSYSVTLATELAARGTVVHLATMGPPLRAEQRAVLASVPKVIVHESHFALEWMDDPWADVDAAGLWLRQLAATVQPDVVHLNGYAHGAIDFEVPTVVAAHSCVLSWWETVVREPAPPRYAEYRARVEAGLHGADVVVACSHAMLDSLEKHYGPLSHARVVHNGARPPEEVDHTVKERFILACGRAWDPAKNLAALSRVAHRTPWPIRIAGWEVERHPGIDALGWLGPKKLGAWMSRASIFALPARYEPFGLSALEAAQRGAALVLGDLPSQREIWGDAALYVDPSDDDALVRALGRLIDDPVLLRAQATKAALRTARFTARRMVDGILAAYAVARPAAEVACG